MSADVLNLRTWQERKEHVRRLHCGAVTLTRGYMEISGSPDWRLDVVAALSIFMTEKRRDKEEFMLTVASPLPGYHTSLDPHLVVTDEAASDAYLDGKSLSEIACEGLGSFAICFPASGEMRLGAGDSESFATAFSRHEDAVSVYAGLSIDPYGCVTIADVSPYGSEVYADFGCGATESDASAQTTAEPLAAGAKILQFPSKSMS